MSTLANRLWARVRRTESCWLWLGSTGGHGYGTMGDGSRTDGTRRTVRTHRAAWEVTHGPIPDGMHVLHHCDTPACCNPAHLYLGKDAENVADKIARGRAVNLLADAMRAKTHCANGHAYDAANTYLHGTHRQCVTCRKNHNRARRRTVNAIAA